MRITGSDLALNQLVGQQLDLLKRAGADTEADSYYELIQGTEQIQLIVHSQILPAAPVEIQVVYTVDNSVTAYRNTGILHFVPVPAGNNYLIERLVCSLELPRPTFHTFYNETRPFMRHLQRPQTLEYNGTGIRALYTDIPAETSLQLMVALPPDYIEDLEPEEDRFILSELDRGAAMRAPRATNMDHLADLLQSRMLCVILAWVAAVFVVLALVKLGYQLTINRLYPRTDRRGPLGRYRRSVPDGLSTTAVSFMRKRRSFGAGVYAGMLSLVGSGRLRYSHDLFSAPEPAEPAEEEEREPESETVEMSLDTIEAMCSRVFAETGTFSTQQLRRMSRSRKYAELMKSSMVQISRVNRAEIVRNGYLTSASPISILTLILSAITAIGAVFLLLLTRQPISLILLLPVLFGIIVWMNNNHLSRKGQAAKREIHAFRRYLSHFSELDAADQPTADTWHDLAVLAVALECEDSYLEQLARISTLQERIAVGFYRRLGCHDLLNVLPLKRRQETAGPQEDETRQIRRRLGQRLKMGRNEMSAVLLTSLRYST